MNTVVLPPAYAADLVGAVPVGKHHKATGWTGDVLDGSAKLDVQRATARTINQKSIANLPAASMTASKRADDMFGHCLYVGDTTADTLAQGAHEFDAAASEHRSEAFLVAFPRQDHSKAPFATEASDLALIDGLDRKHGVISE